MWFIFTTIGVIVTARIVLAAVTGLFRFYRGHFSGSKLDFRKMSTAVITGGSDGIGKAYALELARLGLKRLVLLGRNREKLEAASKEITQLHPTVEIRLIEANFENTDMYDRIEAEMDDLHDVDLLVNNVGCNINAHKRLDEIKPANFFKSININVVSTWMMSYIVIRKMLADKRRGAIVNISSSVVNYPPRLLLYSTTKTWVSKFSHALRLQYGDEPFGITVQEVEPFFVTTKLARFIEGKWVVTPETCARQSLMTLGHYGTTAGAIRHDILAWLFSLETTKRVDNVMKRDLKLVVAAAERQQRDLLMGQHTEDEITPKKNKDA